jgi:hypothetical protein
MKRVIILFANCSTNKQSAKTTGIMLKMKDLSALNGRPIGVATVKTPMPAAPVKRLKSLLVIQAFSGIYVTPLKFSKKLSQTEKSSFTARETMRL